MMLLSRDFTNLCCMLFELGAAWWFLRPIECEEDRRWRPAAFLVLLPLYLLYFTPQGMIAGSEVYSLANLWTQALRLLFHWACVYAFTRLWTGLPPKTAAYLSGIFNLLYITTQNLRYVVMILLPNTAELRAASAYSVIAADILLLWVIRKTVRVEELRHVSLPQFVLLILCTTVDLFLKWSVITMQELLSTSSRRTELLAFSLIACLSMFAICLLVQMNQQTQEERASLALEHLRLQHEDQNARRSMQANRDISRMYHDMKNHLLAIDSMAGDRDELHAYLQQLLPSMEAYEEQVVTGHETVDALLS